MQSKHDDRSLSDIHASVAVSEKKVFGKNFLLLWGLHI